MPKYTIFNIILIGLLALNLLTVKSTVLGVIALTLFIVFSSLIYSQRYKDRFIFGFLTFIFLTTILTSIFYFTYKLNELSLLLVLFILFFWQFLPKPTPPANTPVYLDTPVYQTKDKNSVQTNFFTALIVYTLFGLGVTVLFKSQTAASIVSPWTVVPRQFLIIFFLMIFTLFYSKKSRTLDILPSFILASSVTLIVYKIGYGFDGFIHEAALRHINQFGAITPKTPYYIGLYGLEIFLSKFSGIDVGIINRILLPLAFGFLIPLFVVRDPISNKKSALFLLLLPISAFIATTPQGLANLFLLIIILATYLLINDRYSVIPNRYFGIFLTLAALATASIHFIAGLPALLFLLLWLAAKKLSGKKIIIITTILALIIPVSFWTLAKLYPDFIKFGLVTNSWPTLNVSLPDLKTHYNSWLDLIYFTGWLGKALLASLVILGFRKIWQDKKLCLTWPYIGMFIVLLVDFVVLRAYFSFPSLIFYEQDNFAKRFYEMSFYFLIPLILIGGMVFLERLNNRDRLIRITSLTILALFATSSVYLSYPRQDVYSASHGFSTGINDLAATRAIEQDAVGEKYVVLANQAVSAAALHEFGFFKPYIKTAQNEVYFYSIPTGGELYKYYLRMVYEKPAAQIALKAAQFTGANIVYLVINDYWWGAKRLIEQAKLEASDWQEINDGKLVIFKYEIKQK